MTARAKGKARQRQGEGDGRLSRVAIVVAIACLATLLPLIAVAPFDRPSADDFAYALATHQAFIESGGNIVSVVAAAVQTSAHYYETWQGLYSATVLMALQPGLAGSQFYQLGAYFTLACLVLSCLYLAYSVERYAFGVKAGYWLPVGALFATCLLQAMPAINECIYWLDGALNYTPFFSLAFVDSGLALCALRTESRARAGVAVALACVGSLAASGANYMPAFFNFLLMFGFLIYGVKCRRFALVLPFACALGGFLLNALAPGTAIRQAAFPDHPGVVSTLVHSVWQALADIHSFTDLTLIIALGLATPFIVSWARRGNATFSWKAFGVLALCAFVVFVGVLCVPYYGTGSFGTGRTRNIAFSVFAFAAFVVYGYGLCCAVQHEGHVRSLAGALVARCDSRVAPLVAVVGVALMVVFGSVAVGHGNSLLAARDLASGDAQAYAAAYDERERVLLDAGEGEDVTVGPVTVHPRSVFFSDIVNETDDWSVTVAQYYGLGAVHFQPAEDGPADANGQAGGGS